MLLFFLLNKHGVGVAIRDEIRLVVGALSKNLNLPLGPMEVEAKDFEEGVLLVRDIGIHEIILEGDSFVVSNAIAGRMPSPSSIASVVHGIISYKNAVASIKESCYFFFSTDMWGGCCDTG
ncbi:hypothetical protein CFP56_001615 [Quercus suber]|uniref:RNase H type-1 domain-containing protein n=1 Tax=Quercus suber TaxID=58331 RepID=A0AAW0LGD2_QUESU